MKKLFTRWVLFFLFALIPLAVGALEVPEAGATYSFPLPAPGNFVNVVYNMAQAGTAQIFVYNEAGALVLTADEIKPPGLQTTQFCLCPMPPGVYLYRVFLKYDSGNQERLRTGKIVVIH